MMIISFNSLISETIVIIEIINFSSTLFSPKVIFGYLHINIINMEGYQHDHQNFSTT